VGIALVLGRFDIATRGSFLLLLQLLGINLAAALVFRTFGLTSKGARYTRGKRWLFPVVLGVTVVLLSGLLTWQFSPSVALQRTSLEQQATATIQTLVQQQAGVEYLNADVRFTQATDSAANKLMAIVYVQDILPNDQSNEAISADLSAAIKTELNETLRNTVPLVQVTVLEP
jgi:uncharacterized membrane protein